MSILKDVRSEFDMADITSSSYWSKLGNLLLQAHEAYLVPFDKHLAGADLFVNATLDTIYEGRERWDISSEMAYDRTSQPVSDGTFRSWFKLRKFPASLAWRAHSTAIQLDSENYEPWLGKAKVDLILRRFEDSHSSLKQVARIRSFDVSGGLVPASEIVGFDVASTLHWLAKLIDIKHSTVAFPLIEPDLHRIQLEALLEHIRITRRIDKVVDLIVLLLKRPLDLDSSTDPQGTRSKMITRTLHIKNPPERQSYPSRHLRGASLPERERRIFSPCAYPFSSTSWDFSTSHICRMSYARHKNSVVV